jgi:hypothetical protein
LPPIQIGDVAINARPVDGRPEGLQVAYIDDEVIDDDATTTSPREDEHESSEDPDDPDAEEPDDPGDLEVNGSLIAQ